MRRVRSKRGNLPVSYGYQSHRHSRLLLYIIHTSFEVVAIAALAIGTCSVLPRQFKCGQFRKNVKFTSQKDLQYTHTTDG